MDDLNDLAYFAHVAEQGGFAAAERVTGIAKSKLSRRVAALEQQLGVRLLQRSTRRFAITEVGHDVLRHARAMLAEAEAAQALANEQARTPRGTVHLSCPPALLQYAVADMLARFLNAWPQVRLQVQATNRNVDVWQDGVDVALRVRTTQDRFKQDEVVRSLALSPHLLVAAPRLFTYAAPPTEVQALERLPAVSLGNSPDERQWLLRGPDGAQQAVTPDTRLVADDMGALLCAVQAGVGCAILPQLLVHQQLERGELIELLPGWRPAHGIIQAVYASRHGLRPAVRSLIDALAGEFGRLSAEGVCLRLDEASI